MYTLFIILFLNITKQIQLAGSAGKEQPLSESENNVLPLIMIEYEGEFLPPTYIENASTLTNLQSGLLGNTQFLRDEEYGSGRKVVFCPPKAKYQKRIKYLNSIENYFNEHCLFEKTFGDSEILKCEETPTPILLKDTSARCGPDDEGSLYEFVYEELPCDGFSYFKLYTICYHDTKKTTIFTKHEVISATLFAYDEMYYDYLKTFTMMTDEYGYFESEVLEKQRDEYEKRASDSETKMKHLAQKLVPSEHLFFAVWKMPTFHYANVMPQLENLQSLWTHITDLILKGSRSMIGHSHFIYTGAFQLPEPNEENSTEFTPDEDITLPTPDIWVCMVIQFPKAKISSAPNQGVVFVMSNHLGEQEDRKQVINEYCGQSSCENTLKKKFAQIHGYIWCCSATEQLQRLFGFQLDSLQVLHIHELNFEEELDYAKLDFDDDH